MDLITFIISVFCICDDWLKDKQLRQRGPAPTMSDSEVLTMEIVGEFLGYDEDKALYDFFRRYWHELFPAIATIDRTTFVRQAANLWSVKQQLWQALLAEVVHDEQISIVDSFPLPVCRFARANRCKLFKSAAAFGYDEVAKQTYYGFRMHVRICWPGVIVSTTITPANVHDLHALDDLTEDVQGWLLGDRNYWSPQQTTRLAEQGLQLLAPFKSKKREKKRWPLWLVHMRRRIETVFGQLVGRFQVKKVWARDMWHFCSRWLRKILSHTFAIFFAQQVGLESPLQFAGLITD